MKILALYKVLRNSVAFGLVCSMLLACGTQEPAPVVNGWQQHASVYPTKPVLPPAPAPARTPPPAPVATVKPVAAKPASSVQPAPAVSKQAFAAPSATGWVWPAPGVIVQNYDVGGNKGINIAGLRNSPVLAARSGTVVYIGTGLPGYGKMIILKHSANLLTAYAHNNEILVKEGQQVQAGQPIAKMGDTGATRVALHFEVRKDGKPVDPLLYLPKRGA